MSLWTGKLSIGNRILDSEHKKLHGVLGEISHLIEARNIAGLPKAFEQLESRLCAYFAAEEHIARAVNFDFARHRLAHQYLLDELQRIRNELMGCSDIRRLGDGNYAFRLMSCLLRHVKEDSRPLKIVLDTCFYDFNP